MLNITTQPMRKLALVLLPLLAMAGFNVYADAHEPPPPPAVLEAFTCNYNPGKDRDDLDAATSFHLKQAEKAEFTPPGAFLWTHNKGAAPAQLVWLNVHDNLVAFGATDDAAAASSDMAEVRPRYNTVVTCQDNLGTVSTIVAPEADTTPADGGSIATYACSRHHGVHPDAIGDLTAHIARVNAEMGDAALAAAYQIQPLTTGPQSADVILVAVAENTEAWATYIATLNTTPAGQQLIRHLNTVVDCDMNLWRSEQVIAAPEDG